MARPRLVREGLPIGTVSKKDEDEDTMMILDQRPSTRNTTTTAKSSLLHALGGKRMITKRAHNSRFVIGADRQMKAADPKPLDDDLPDNHASDRQQQFQSTNNHQQHHPSSSQHPSQFSIGDHLHMMTTETHLPQHIAYSSSAEHHPVYSMHPNHQHHPHPFNGLQQPDVSHPYTHNHLHNSPEVGGVPLSSHPHTHRHSNTTASYHPTPRTTTTRTHIQIGRDDRPTESMEGVEDHSIKPPLVVLDGANVAHAYGKTLHSRLSSQEVQPDARGILVACEYFARANLRVLVVLPAHWFQRKNPSSQGIPTSNNDAFLYKVIEELDYQGILVPSPPSDDDDAYALTIAQRENARAVLSHRHGPGYVLSNDMFRDAQNRDATGDLKTWLTKGLSSSPSHGGSSLAAAATGSQDMGPGRISYTFCDMGRIDDNGERELDFIPNPRHPLIVWVESQRLTVL